MSDMTLCIDLGLFGEVEVEVGYDYQPEEKQTWDEPGCPESIDLHTVTLWHTDVYSKLDKDTITSIEDMIKDEIEYQREEAGL